MLGEFTLAGYRLQYIDLYAFLFFVVTWACYSLLTDRKHRKGEDSVLQSMNHHRQRWMRQMLKRENRLMDINSVGNLIRSISFFASTTVIIIIGLVGMLGKSDIVKSVISTVPFANEGATLVWEFKILLLLVIFIYAFFKYTWSLRQYNYVNIMISAAPLPYEKPELHDKYAHQAAVLTGNAARHFGLGLRAYYFAMAGLAWFINPVLFMVATALVIAVLHRREFRSRTLDAIMVNGL